MKLIKKSKSFIYKTFAIPFISTLTWPSLVGNYFTKDQCFREFSATPSISSYYSGINLSEDINKTIKSELILKINMEDKTFVRNEDVKIKMTGFFLSDHFYGHFNLKWNVYRSNTNEDEKISSRFDFYCEKDKALIRFYSLKYENSKVDNETYGVDKALYIAKKHPLSWVDVSNSKYGICSEFSGYIDTGVSTGSGLISMMNYLTFKSPMKDVYKYENDTPKNAISGEYEKYSETYTMNLTNHRSPKISLAYEEKETDENYVKESIKAKLLNCGTTVGRRVKDKVYPKFDEILVK